MGLVLASTGELARLQRDSCCGLRYLQAPNNAELVAKEQKCCPELAGLAILGTNESGIFSPTRLGEAFEWCAHRRAYAMSFWTERGKFARLRSLGELPSFDKC